MSTYYYTCYGSTFSSPFPCPELREIDKTQETQIQIIEGETPDELSFPLHVAARFSIAPGELLLQVDGVARFWVTDGTKITIQRASNASMDDVRIFLYGTAFGAAILQRGQVPLHATTIVKDGRAIAFTGPSGAGKSTTAHTFIKRGWKLVADDVSVLTAIKGTLHVQPGFPSLKLWRDVLEASQVDVSQLKEIRVQIDKYRWNTHENFHPAPTPLHTIIGLIPHDLPELKIEPLRGAEKFMFLTQNTYRRQMIKGMTNNSKIFAVWANTLDQIQFSRILRPKTPFQPNLLADKIEELIK